MTRDKNQAEHLHPSHLAAAVAGRALRLHTVVVEAIAEIGGRRVWLDVGVGYVEHLEGRRRLCLHLGALPCDGRLYIPLADVLLLDLQGEGELDPPVQAASPQ